MIQVTVNDRLGRKVIVKCLPEDTIFQFKQVLAEQMGLNSHNNISLQKGHTTLKDHLSLDDYEIHDATNLELYYS